MRRRFLSVLLSLCLVLGLLPTAAFAKGMSYVALGDSITVGYGLSDDEEAFPDIIAEKYGYELKNLANSGATSQDLLGVVESNADVLSDADLITITIGGNDLMAALYQYLADEYNAEKQTTLTGGEVQMALLGTHPTINQVTMLTFAAEVIEGFAASDAAKEALTDFGTNLGTIITDIKAVNPDVTIIVANQYNPYTFLAEEAESDPILALFGYSDMIQAVADAFDAGLTQLNGAINAGASTGAYSVADVYKAFQGAGQNPCNASVSTAPMSLNLDFHPNAYGHELMAEVIDALLQGSGEPGGGEQPEPQVESLWVNGVNILEAESYTVQCGEGTAVYDPKTNALTLDNATITDSHTGKGIDVDGGDLTIVLEGDSTIANNITIGIYADRSLTIEGDGRLQIYTELSAIFVKENLTIRENVKIDAAMDTDSVSYYCIESSQSIIIEDTPTISAAAKPYISAIRATKEITVNGEIYRTDHTSDGMSCAKIKEGKVVSGLHTPTVYVNGVNMSITTNLSLGDGGWASYDPATSTLTLCNAVITEPYHYAFVYSAGQTDWPIGIYADTDLTIILEGTNSIQDDAFDYAIRSENSVTIRGSGSLSADADYYGIYVRGSLTIKDVTVALNVVDGNGISAEGDVAIKDSTVMIDAGQGGIVGSSVVRVTDSRVDITARGSDSSSGGDQGLSAGTVEICGDSNVTIQSYKTAVFVSGSITITGGTVEAVSTAYQGILSASGTLTVTGGKLTAIGNQCGIWVPYSDLVLEGGTVTAIGQEENSYGIWAQGLTMERGAALTTSGTQAAIILNTEPSLPDGYLPDGYSVRKADNQGGWRDIYTIAKDGATVTLDSAGTLTGAATSVTLMEYAVDEDDDDDDRDTGSTTESERNPDGSLTTTVTKPDGTTVETTRNPDGSKEVVENQKDGTVVTTATDKSGNETKTTENPDGTSVIAVTRTDGSTSATTVDEDGLTVTVAALSDSAVAQTGTVSLPMPAVTAASDLKSAPAVTLDLPADTTVKVEIPVANVTAGTVAVLVKADGTSEIVKTSVATDSGVILTLSGGETVKLVDNSKTLADVAATFWGADAVAFASSRELFNGTSATDFSPNAPMNRAMIVTVLARLDGTDTTTGSTWYEAGTQWAVACGISDGSSLDQNLTREQLATMLYRYAQYRGCDVSGSGNLLSYPDAASVSDYAVEAIQWACGAGIIGGKDGLLDPAGSATRAEVATMLMRFVAGL